MATRGKGGHPQGGYGARGGFQRQVQPVKIEAYTSPTQVLVKDGAVLPRHPEEGGCAWVDHSVVGRVDDEGVLFRPGYKRHYTSGDDPGEAFGLEPLDVNFDACTTEELQEQVLKAVERDITPRQSLEILRILTSTPNGKATVACLNRVLVTCKAHGSHAHALKAFRTYGKEIAEPSTFKILSDIAKLCKNLDVAYITLTAMEARKMAVDEKTLGNLVGVGLDEAAMSSSKLTATQKGYFLDAVLGLYNGKLTEKQKVFATSQLALLGKHQPALRHFDLCTNSPSFPPAVYDALLEACHTSKRHFPSVFTHMKKSNLKPSHPRLLSSFYSLHADLDFYPQAKNLYDMAAAQSPPDVKTLIAYISMEAKAVTAKLPDALSLETLLKKWEEVAPVKKGKGNGKEDVLQEVMGEGLDALITAVISTAKGVEGLGKVAELCQQQHNHDVCEVGTLETLLGAIYSGEVTPARRGEIAESGYGQFLNDISNFGLDEWAFKAVCTGVERKEATVSTWSRHIKELLEKSAVTTKSEQEDDAEDELDAEMALAAFLEADEQTNDEKTPSFFTPQLAEELMRDTEYLAILDSTACKDIFTSPPTYQRLASIVSQPQAVKCLVTPRTLVTLHKESPDTLSALLGEYVKSPTPWVLPLPFSVSYEVATNPYRARPRKRRRLTEDAKQNEPAPSLKTEVDTLIALCYRLQGTEMIGTKKTILVSNDEASRKAAAGCKIVPLSVGELLTGEV